MFGLLSHSKSLYKQNGMDSIGHFNIFRNQPSYRTFSSSIERTDDTLFAFLNEVDTDILSEEQRQLSQLFASYSCSFSRKDPRTQLAVLCQEYDYTTDRLALDFPNPQNRYSMLNKVQYAACMRALLAWQSNSVVDEKDFMTWCATGKKRNEEQQVVQKHIFEYANAQKERLFKPMKELVMQYDKWYQSRMAQLRKRYLDNLNTSYTTHSGLPQLSQCKSLNSRSGMLEDVQILCRAGQVRIWPKIELSQNELSVLRLRLERFVCAEEDVQDDMVKQRIAAKLEEQLQQTHEDVYVLPLESLLLLFLPGAYIDLPTEMQLHIQEIPGSEYKCIKFHEPLPARHCGWHTNSHILTQAYAAYAPCEWISFTPSVAAKKIPASKQEPLLPAKYKLKPIDEKPPIVGGQKSNCALVSWRLAQDEEDQSLQMYSSLSIPAVSDSTIQRPLGCQFFKLESKPNCGCEVMTKYELLRSWLQLKLLQTDRAFCTRVSLQDFTLLLEEQLTVSALEQQLNEYYHINMAQQLCQLYEFLKLLRSITPGEYLLRCTTKYKDKFLLCRPTMEPTPQSFKLLDLLTGMPPPNEIDFLTQSESYLPISPTLCSRFHEQQQLMPCSFPVKERGKPSKKKQSRLDMKPAAKLVQRTGMRTRNPKAKTGRKKKKNLNRSRKKAAAKTEQQELDKFMCL